MVRGPMADGYDRHAAPGRHTHRAAQARPGQARLAQARLGPPRSGRPGRGRPGVRRVSAVALVMLVLQYGLGMILNFYVGVPAADAHASIFTEIATAPLALTAHALLGVCLVGTAILAVARAMALRDRTLAVLAAAGLAAIVGAFVAGEMFVKNGQDSTSFAMAMLTGAALLCYVATLILSGGIPGARPGQRDTLEQETEPLLVSVPAARPEDPLEYPDDDFGVEPGWDDDPGWAERLRQDQDTGWPGQSGWPQNPGLSQPPARRPVRRADRGHRADWEHPADWEHQPDWEQQAGWEQQAPWEQRPADWEQHQAGPPDYRPDWRERPQGPNWRL